MFYKKELKMLREENDQRLGEIEHLKQVHAELEASLKSCHEEAYRKERKIADLLNENKELKDRLNETKGQQTLPAVQKLCDLSALLDRYEAETLTKAHKTAMLEEARAILKNSGCEEKEAEDEGAQQ